MVELLSESTGGRKMEIYARVLKVPEYVLFDPWTQVFEFYRLHPETHAYARVEPDASGRVHSTELGYALGLWEGEYLEIRCPWLRFFDDGELVPTAAEAAQRQAEVALRDAEAAQRQAEVAFRDAEAAEARAARLEARLREHGLDPDD